MYKLYRLTAKGSLRKMGEWKTEEARENACKAHGWFSTLNDSTASMYFYEDPDGSEGEVWKD